MTSSTLKLDDSSFDVSKFQTLTGQDNLIAWFRDFKSLANSRNLWDILSGDESIITKPEWPTKPSLPKTRAAKADQTDASNVEHDVYRGLIAEYQLNITEFKLDLEQWEKQDARVRSARSLLANTVHPSIRGSLQPESDPTKALKELKSLCQMADGHALQYTLSKIDDLTWNSGDNTSSFLNTLRLY